jgi:hypothetical protein
LQKGQLLTADFLKTPAAHQRGTTKYEFFLHTLEQIYFARLVHGENGRGTTCASSLIRGSAIQRPRAVEQHGQACFSASKCWPQVDIAARGGLRGGVQSGRFQQGATGRDGGPFQSGGISWRPLQGRFPPAWRQGCKTRRTRKDSNELRTTETLRRSGRARRSWRGGYDRIKDEAAELESVLIRSLSRRASSGFQSRPYGLHRTALVGVRQVRR